MGKAKSKIDAASIKEAAELIQKAGRVAVLTGAGISKESGIPTFREAQTGLWAQYDPELLATPGGFKRDPKLVWQWYDHRRVLCSSSKPNLGHLALAELESLLPNFMLVTQNVDGLHRTAGSTKLVELHGSLSSFICYDQRHAAENIPVGLKEPPVCKCGSLVRPDVVWFGEMLPEGIYEQAHKYICSSRLLLIIGTSGLVQPAAALPLAAKLQGVKIIEINMESTPITEIADVFIQAPAGEVMPGILTEFKSLSASTT